MAIEIEVKANITPSILTPEEVLEEVQDVLYDCGAVASRDVDLLAEMILDRIKVVQVEQD